MKARFLLICAVALVLAGCATADRSDFPLHEAYETYSQTLTHDNIEEKANRFFSNDLISGADLSDEQVQSQLLFHTRMASSTQYFETTDEDQGCLVVNGQTDTDEPLSFRLAYVNEPAGWVISGVDLFYPESESELPGSPDCSMV